VGAVARKIAVVGKRPIISRPPAHSTIVAKNPFRIAAGSSGNARRASSGRNPRSTPHFRAAPEQSGDPLQGWRTRARSFRCVARISSAEGSRSTVPPFGRRPVARARYVADLGESRRSHRGCDVAGPYG
jgi:hypothetical protein